MPRHVAIVMDGNGRWAKQQKMPRLLGHKAGVDAAREVIRTAARAGIEVLTLFGFSRENWRRPKEEVDHIFELFFQAMQNEVAELHQNNVQIRFIGSRDKFSPSLVKKIQQTEQLTASNTGLVLVLAIDYGGQWDICQGVKHILTEMSAGKLNQDDITPELFNQYVSLGDLPSPDLFVRPGGEQRISNFLLWQLAYSELYFPNVLWPDFDAEAFQQALEFFASRQRRFGFTGEQIQQQTIEDEHA